MTDWLNEVLDDVLWHLTKPGSMQDPYNVRVAKAHKLISAQLIRERLDETHLYKQYFRGRTEGYANARIEALTNKLKELEDE